MQYNRDNKEKAFEEMVEETLARFKDGDFTTDKAGDGFSILRWARAGILTVKSKD